MEEKNRKVIKITAIILGVIAALCVLININSIYIFCKAAVLYGNGVCDGSDEPLFAPSVMTTYECELCGKTQEWSNGFSPEICPTCAYITNRCKYCGKKIRQTSNDD